MKSMFSKLTALLALILLAAPGRAEDLKLGMQTWTLRNLSFEQLVDFCAKHQIKYVQLIPNHIDLAKKDDWQRKKEALAKAELIPYTFGVAGTSLNKEENRALFECAKFFGMKLIVVEPGDFKIFDSLEELAKEYDIKVAIHNHGITSMYGNPAVVKNVLVHRDPKYIGVCLDVGWIASSRFDPAKIFSEYNGRVFDIHLKDKKVTGGPKGDTNVDVTLGEGDANLAGLFKTLKEKNYTGVMSIETDQNLKDPTEYVTKGIEFVKANAPK